MKIKKKELRRGLAQLPINYPDPDVVPEALLDLGGSIDLDQEMCAVEAICKQLGHNELRVRQAALSQVPAYLRQVLAPLAKMEVAYEAHSTLSCPQAFSSTTTAEVVTPTNRLPPHRPSRAIQTAAHDGDTTPLHTKKHAPQRHATPQRTSLPFRKDGNEGTDGQGGSSFMANLLEGLQMYRERVAKAYRQSQQRESMQRFQERQREQKQQLAMRGKYGVQAGCRDAFSPATKAEEAAAAENAFRDRTTTTVRTTPTSGEDGEKAAEANLARATAARALEAQWWKAWADVELVLLKLCRGLFFCLWHSDKPLDQLACADTLASFISMGPTSRSQILLGSCYFRVLSREWPKVDHYRMDKYLALVRRLFQQMLQIIRREWDHSSSASSSSSSLTSLSRECCARFPDAEEEEKEKEEEKEEEEGTEKKGKRRRNPSTTKEAKPNKKDRKEASDRAGRSPPRDREEEDEAKHERGNDIPDASSSSSSSSSPLTTRGIMVHCFTHFLPPFTPSFRRVVEEVVFLFQMQIFPNPTSIGMTMHLADISFEELVKALEGGATPPGVWVTVAAGIPLYAMSQGNGIEKRVLDHFFPPIAAGMLASRRTTQFSERLRSTPGLRLHKEGTAGGEVVVDVSSSPAKRSHRTVEEIEEEATALAMADTMTLMEQLLWVCQSFSVCRGTVRVVRVMFGEAELALRQALHPEQYTPLSHAGRERRIAQELKEVDDTRQRVREERAGVKEAKRAVKRAALEEKVEARREELWKAHQKNSSSLSSSALAEEDEVEERDTKEMSTKKREGVHQKTPKKKEKEAKKTSTVTPKQHAREEKSSPKSSAAAVRSSGEMRAKEKKTTTPTSAVPPGLDRRSIREAIKMEEAEAKKGKKVKIVRNTKRKKDYHLTKKDLMGSDDDA